MENEDDEDGNDAVLGKKNKYPTWDIFIVGIFITLERYQWSPTEEQESPHRLNNNVVILSSGMNEV